MTTTILPNWETVGKEFVELYYRTFATNREGVMNLYHPQAMVTFEENQAQGHEQIKNTLTSKLSFQSIAHDITKIDCQPTFDNGVIILVTGRLKADEDPPHAFSQTFLVKSENSSFFIYHDIFRLSIHNSV